MGAKQSIFVDMKISLKLPEDVVAFVDGEVQRGDYPSRSAACADALVAWRAARLEGSYAQAFAEIDPIWDETVSDGINQATW